MYAYIVRYAFILVANASSKMVLPTAGQRLANVQALRRKAVKLQGQLCVLVFEKRTAIVFQKSNKSSAFEVPQPLLSCQKPLTLITGNICRRRQALHAHDPHQRRPHERCACSCNCRAPSAGSSHKKFE
jgi:hypothetical protein